VSWWGRILGRKEKPKALPAARMVRGYAGAQNNRLTADWRATDLSADGEIKVALQVLRARARDLVLNNDYARRFIKLVGVNIVGPNGIVLQSKAVLPNGEPDVEARRIIEAAWWEWSAKANASADGRRAWRDIQRLAVQTVARDGEAIIRKVHKAGNPFRFTLQMIEPDLLDHRLNQPLTGGNTIRMGIEYDQWGAPVAYHFATSSASDAVTFSGKATMRVPASEIIHLYIEERVGQSRGVTWLHSAMARMRMTLGYEHAELVAARVSAEKMGFLTTEKDNDVQYEGDEKDSEGRPISQVEAGTVEVLPPGMKFESFDPTHPAGNFGPFVKANLRGIASGLGVSYNTLANDLEGVNYSSIRAGLLEERDLWMELQEWLIEHLCREVYAEWLPMAIVTGQIPFGMTDLPRIKDAEWQARRWAWVDPMKDTLANIEAVNAGFKSRSMVIREAGNDPDTVYEELATDKEKTDGLLDESGGADETQTETDDGQEEASGLKAVS
jgi:lambda family phage portal protein